MIILAYILVLITVLYTLWLLIISLYWLKSKNDSATYSNIPVSIIVPFRNEEQNLKNCIDSILNQDYDSSAIELILVNDHSTDKSIELISFYKNVKLLHLSENNDGKKSAITQGVQHASHEIIIIRDADTNCGNKWLQGMVSKQKQCNADMVIGQIVYKEKHSFLHIIQVLEYFAISVITGGTANMKKPIMCNGANLLFTKTIFNRVNGYAENDFIASGDDVFLLNKITAINSSNVAYLKHLPSLVLCDTEKTIGSFIHQRVRWAKKNKHNYNPINALTAFLVVSSNFSWAILGILSPFYKGLSHYFLIIVLLKCIIDFLLLFLASSFYQQKKLLWWFPLFFCIYPIELLIVTLVALFGKTKWKDRFLN